MLANRPTSFVMRSTLRSAGRAGRAQESRMRMEWKDYRRLHGRPVKGVVSKALVRYERPREIRNAGYLIVHNHDRPSDQFMYLPSRRRVQRVSLRGEAILGTDFSVEDVVPREIEEATYRRLPDERLDGASVYVVEALPLEIADSEYSRFVFYIDRPRYVPLRTRYWDRAGVEIKDLRADTASIRVFDDVFVPMLLTMRNLRLDTSTELVVDELDANADLPDSRFGLNRLEFH